MRDYSDLDPSIAEMLSNVKDTADESEDIDLSEFESAGEKKFSMEDFARRSKLFDSKADSVKKKTKSIHEVDLSQHEFEPASGCGVQPGSGWQRGAVLEQDPGQSRQGD